MTPPLGIPSGMRVAVLMLAYGGPSDLKGVAPFLGRVLAPREPVPSMVVRARERYRAIGGGSPLVPNTLRQAAALDAYLHVKGGELIRPAWSQGAGSPAAKPTETRVFVGMRFTEPWLADALEEALVYAGDGVVAAVVMASHQSRGATGAYHAQVERLRSAWKAEGVSHSSEVVFVDGWQRSAGYLEAVAVRVAEARARLAGRGVTGTPWLLFTAHSLPVDPAMGDPEYERDLVETAAAVARTAGGLGWRLGYQSRSERPGVHWLEPEAAAVLAEEAAGGRGPVVVVPLGFVAEHLETLYDLDVALRAEAERVGLPMERAGTVQDHPAFVAALAEAVADKVWAHTLAGSASSLPGSVGPDRAGGGV